MTAATFLCFCVQTAAHSIVPTSVIHLFEGRVTSAGIACAEVTLVGYLNIAVRGGDGKKADVCSQHT